MWLYRALDVVFPTSFAAKLVFVALVAMALPPFLVAAYLYTDGGVRALAQPVFVVLLTATGISTAALVLGLISLMEPVVRMGRVLNVIQKKREFTPLPADHRDDLGQMMAASNGIAQAMGAKLDPAFSRNGVDPLTGLLDMDTFAKLLKRQGAGSLVQFTLDDFDGLHRDFGENAVEGLLVRVGALIQGEIRNGDLVARTDDHAFSVWLKDAGKVVSRHVAERICNTVKLETAEFQPGATLSAGLAVRAKEETIDDLRTRALAAWKVAGSQGNRVELCRKRV